MDFIFVLFGLVVVLLIVCSACKWVAELCDYRTGAEGGKAVFFTLFFTPIAGLLYVVAHPLDSKESKDNDNEDN